MTQANKTKSNAKLQQTSVLIVFLTIRGYRWGFLLGKN